MMYQALVASCVLAVCLAAPGGYFNVALDDHWTSFKATYSKNYLAQEEIVRRTIWEKNVAYIRDHNLQADMGVFTYWLGINKYADLTAEEYAKYLTGYQRSNTTKSLGSHFVAPNNVEIPDTVDWRAKGYVTPVKDQGQCGSCWAFSTTGSLEGQHFKASGTLVSLSEQNLVDCSGSYGNMGCNGGLMDNAFQYIRDNGGIDTEASYPYTARDGTCKFDASNVGATCTGYTDIRSGDENALKQAVATVGPISVAIDASSPSFQLYRTGVYNDLQCSSVQLDHGVLAVGYGTLSGQDYWLVKNSWSDSWGDAGYIMMSRNKNNQCGIATDASYPLV